MPIKSARTHTCIHISYRPIDWSGNDLYQDLVKWLIGVFTCATLLCDVRVVIVPSAMFYMKQNKSLLQYSSEHYQMLLDDAIVAIHNILTERANISSANVMKFKCLVRGSWGGGGDLSNGDTRNAILWNKTKCCLCWLCSWLKATHTVRKRYNVVKQLRDVQDTGRRLVASPCLSACSAECEADI